MLNPPEDIIQFVQADRSACKRQRSRPAENLNWILEPMDCARPALQNTHRPMEQAGKFPQALRFSQVQSALIEAALKGAGVHAAIKP